MPAQPSPSPAAVDELLRWFELEGRDWPWRATRDRWVILVSETCLQQTQVERAARHLERILERFPDAASLADSRLSELLVLWQGLGYPRRARNLWRAAQIVARDGWPDDYTDLPGVGPYTAAALRCFADEQAVLPADINTRRVVSRLFPGGAPPPPAGQAWAWGQSVMELGQRVCKARARCEACPVSGHCPTAFRAEPMASPRQRPYANSLRARRGSLLRGLSEGRTVHFAADAAAAESLVADGLARRRGQLLLPVD